MSDSDLLPPSLMKKDKTFFTAAQCISELSDHKFQLGCVVVDHHRIISSGHNSKSKFHRMQAEIDKQYFGITSLGPLHAESDALIPLIKHNVDLSNASIYVFRKDKNNNLALARPCPRCMTLIKKCGIKKIRYTTPDGVAFEKIGWMYQN